MALPNSREELKEYCLRKLGNDVLEINVSNDQLEDRIDEALKRYAEYHFDGSERVYIGRKITATSITFASATTGSFVPSDIITGGASGATANVYDAADDNLSIRVIKTIGTFQDGEVITGSISGATATLAVNAVVIGDLDRKYFSFQDPVLSVQKILPLSTSTTNLFDFQYQFTINNIPSLVGMDLISYDMFNKHVALLNFMLVGIKNVRFNKKSNRAFVDLNWNYDLRADQYVVFEAYVALDPEEHTEIYSDEWLIEYVTQLIKKQWGDNLSKFSGMQLPGGITFDGAKIASDAQAQIEKLEIDLVKKFQNPIDFEIG